MKMKMKMKMKMYIGTYFWFPENPKFDLVEISNGRLKIVKSIMTLPDYCNYYGIPTKNRVLDKDTGRMRDNHAFCFDGDLDVPVTPFATEGLDVRFIAGTYLQFKVEYFNEIIEMSKQLTESGGRLVTGVIFYSD